MPLALHHAALAARAARPDLLAALKARCNRRLAVVRRSLGGGALGVDEVAPFYASALAFGYYRALIERFSEVHGLTDGWWLAHRRAHGGHGRDRTLDFEIIVAEFPDFPTFVPAVPITDDDVLDAAAREFRDLVAARGTEYAALKYEDRSAAMRTSEQWGGAKLSFDDNDAMAEEFVDPTAHLEVEEVILQRMTQQDQDVLGAEVTRVCSLALQSFGPNGLFWLLEWLFLPKKYAEILRILGQNEATLGATEFERVRRDMTRKLPEVEAHMLALLRDDPAILALRERLRGAAPTPAPPESPTAAAARATYAAERARRMTPRAPRLVPA